MLLGKEANVQQLFREGSGKQYCNWNTGLKI